MRPHKFKEYFKNDYKYGSKISLFFFIVFLIATILNPSDFKSIIEMLIFSFLLSLSMGFSISILIFWYSKMYSPSKRIKILKTKSFDLFIQNEFINKVTHLENRKGKYETRIWFDIMSPFTINRSCINIHVSCNINPEKSKELSKKYLKEKILFSEKGILGVCEFIFKTPKDKILESKFESLIQIAESNKFEKRELEKFDIN